MCTFCNLGYPQQYIPDETFTHLFFDCTFTRRVQDRIEQIAFGELFPNSIQEKKLRWMGISSHPSYTLFVRLFYMTAQFFVWKAKLKVTLPNDNYIFGETIMLLDDACRASKVIDSYKSKCTAPVTSIWHRLRKNRW